MFGLSFSELCLLVIVAIICLAWVAYRVVTTAVWGAGLGKMAMGLRVVVDKPDAATKAPGWGRAWRRWLVPQVVGLIPLPATGMIAFLETIAVVAVLVYYLTARG